MYKEKEEIMNRLKANMKECIYAERELYALAKLQSTICLDLLESMTTAQADTIYKEIMEEAVQEVETEIARKSDGVKPPESIW